MPDALLEIEPARAVSRDPSELWDDSNWRAEPKIDGWRFLMHVGGGLDRMHLTGRRRSSVTGLLSEKGMCAPCLAPGRLLEDHPRLTVLDGEVTAPRGCRFGDIAGIMNVDPEDSARRIQEIGPPRYVVFDVLILRGEDLREHSYLERRQILQRLCEEWDNDLLELIESVGAAKRAFYEKVLANGGEGVVLKRWDGEWGQHWIKVKRSCTVDAVVTGLKPGNGKYVGQCGALLVSVWRDGALVEIGAASGMDDFTRSTIDSSWIGRVVEIEAQEWARDRLRHPRFVRERPDVDGAKCTWDAAMLATRVQQKREEIGEQMELLR